MFAHRRCKRIAVVIVIEYACTNVAIITAVETVYNQGRLLSTVPIMVRNRAECCNTNEELL